MPAIQCPECGKELFPQNIEDSNSPCLCPQCGREVYVRAHVKANVKCPSCGKENEKDVAV